MDKSELAALSRLNDVLSSLLGPGGCPWDQKQTALSLCDYVVEEAFELVDAIRSGDVEDMMEELGDVMFLLLFVAKAAGKDGFSLEKSLDGAAAKMIRRHPHVFENVKIESQDELMRNWERIKRAESNKEGKGALDGVPGNLPPLLRAYRLNAKAARLGFTWDNDVSQREALKLEEKELEEAVSQGDKEKIQEEFGDYLFGLAEYGRRLGVKASEALDFANRKFVRRFEGVEKLAEQRGLKLQGMSLDAFNALWDEVKAGEK